MNIRGIANNLGEFGTRLLGTRVHQSDKQLKDLHNQANDIAQKNYIKASKRPFGWGFVPGSENYRNKKAHSNPEFKPIFDKMEGIQEQRRLDSRDTNRARLGVLGATALIGGGIAGAHYLRKRKKEKEKEEERKMYGFNITASEQLNEMYKEAGLKDFGKKVADAGRSIKGNFAHAEELDHLYGGSKAKRVKDILTFKRAREANKILIHSKGGRFTSLDNTYGNPALGKINEHTTKLNDINSSIADRLKAIDRWKPTPERDLQEAQYVSSHGGKHSKAYIGYERFKKNQQDAINNYKGSADKIYSHLEDRYGQMKKTRDNELVKSIVPYAAVAAATAGGAYLYKKHKKKKEEDNEKSEN